MKYFKVFKFHGSKSARLAFNNMELTDNMGLLPREDEIAIISVNSSGIYNIEGSWSKSFNILSDRLQYFTPLSNLIGIIFGPHGAFANAEVDESIEKLIGHIKNIEINDPVLDELADSMGKDVSLLVVLGENSIVELFTEELAEYNVETYEIIIRDEIHSTIETNI